MISACGQNRRIGNDTLEVCGHSRIGVCFLVVMLGAGNGKARRTANVCSFLCSSGYTFAQGARRMAQDHGAPNPGG